MDLVWLYWIITLPCCAYVVLRGGYAGLCGGLIIISGSLLSLLAALSDPRWTGLHFPLLWVDLAVMAAFGGLAFRTEKFWPLWASAFQFAAVLVHLARLIAPAASPKLYQGLQTFWSLPILASMVIGVALDERRQR